MLSRRHVRDDANAGRAWWNLRLWRRFAHRLDCACERAGIGAHGQSRGSGNRSDRRDRRSAQCQACRPAQRRAFYRAALAAARTVIGVLVSANGKTGMLAGRVQRKDFQVLFRHA